MVTKPPGHPFSDPQKQLPSKIQSLEDCISHLSYEKRLCFELEHFGHFTVGEGDRWTQTEIDTEWARQNAAKAQTTERSPAFVLNLDFKPEPEPEPEFIIMNDDDHPQPVPIIPAKPLRTQFKPSAFETPANYWDEWRAREDIVERHLTPAQYGTELMKKLSEKAKEKELKSQNEVALRLLKKRKSDEGWGKYFYLKFLNF